MAWEFGRLSSNGACIPILTFGSSGVHDTASFTQINPKAGVAPMSLSLAAPALKVVQPGRGRQRHARARASASVQARRRGHAAAPSRSSSTRSRSGRWSRPTCTPARTSSRSSLEGRDRVPVGGPGGRPRRRRLHRQATRRGPRHVERGPDAGPDDRDHLARRASRASSGSWPRLSAASAVTPQGSARLSEQYGLPFARPRLAARRDRPLRADPAARPGLRAAGRRVPRQMPVGIGSSSAAAIPASNGEGDVLPLAICSDRRGHGSTRPS